MKVDIVIPLANLSRNADDWELRYSLRSLAEQDWCGQIMVVGHLPKWVKGVRHIECPDPYNHAKDANIINKILRACADDLLSENFVVNSDDQFIVKKIGLEYLGPWLEYPNPMDIAYAKRTSSLWHRRLVSTIEFCKAHNLPEWVFQCHIPYLVDKKKYVTAMSTVPWGKGNGLLTHLYFNLALNVAPAVEMPGQTLRVTKNIQQPQFEKLIQRATFLNVNNQGLCEPVKNWVEKRFPEKSPWEN